MLYLCSWISLVTRRYIGQREYISDILLACSIHEENLFFYLNEENLWKYAEKNGVLAKKRGKNRDNVISNLKKQE